MEIDRAELRKAMDALDGAFVWDASPQGGLYWKEVQRNLEAMLMAPEPRKPVEGWCFDLGCGAMSRMYWSKAAALTAQEETFDGVGCLIHLREVEDS